MTGYNAAEFFCLDGIFYGDLKVGLGIGTEDNEIKGSVEKRTGS